MNMPKKSPWLIIVLVACVAVAGFFIYRSKASTKRFHVHGAITWVDASKNSACIEFVHPDTGKRMEMTGAIDANCTITLDGKPATLAQLTPGDEAEVFAIWNKKTHRPDPSRILVTRSTHTSGDTD
jgi:hypothetical protein